VQYNDEPSRTWPRAAIVTAAIAGLELVALIVIALAFIAKPFADDAASKARADQTREQVAAEMSPRTETPVLVLNGNGLAGAAGAAAKQMRKLEYPVAGIGDASRRDFELTLVMYREGARPEAVRLARDLGLPAKRAVPLDGMRPKDLLGAELALVLGRRS
jgi:hypothetical protein